MAKVVGYYENNKPEHYEEGNWVLVQMPGGNDDYRLECLNTCSPCSGFPLGAASLYLYDLARQLFRMPVPRGPRQAIEPMADFLNRNRLIVNPFPEQKSSK